MKYWEYQLLNRGNIGTEEAPVWHETFITKRLPQTEANRLIAEKEAYGEITPYDDGQPDPAETPTQLDIIEAQVTYTAMMTDTLLEA